MESSSDEEESALQDKKRSGSVVDVEDLGNIMNNVKKAKVSLPSTKSMTSPYLSFPPS